jgi:hypothetical protein
LKKLISKLACVSNGRHGAHKARVQSSINSNFGLIKDVKKKRETWRRGNGSDWEREREREREIERDPFKTGLDYQADYIILQITSKDHLNRTRAVKALFLSHGGTWVMQGFFHWEFVWFLACLEKQTKF